MKDKRYIILPTKRIIDQFYKETFSLTDASYELEHILAKLIELVDEAKTLRGESPATHYWCEAFVSSVHYDGMADYYDAHQDRILAGALKKLYGSILTVFMQHEHHMHPDDSMVYHRHLNGDVVVMVFRVSLLPTHHTPKQPTIPGPVPWQESS